jgi:hypothetical protein
MVLHTARSVARRAGRLNNKTRLAIVRLSGPYGPEYEAVNLDEGGDASAADWRGVEKHEAEVSGAFGRADQGLRVGLEP